MKMMGLPNYLHWLAWFTKSFLFLLVSAIFMVILMKVRHFFKLKLEVAQLKLLKSFTILQIKFYEDGNLGVLTFSDGTILFVFLLLYIFATICLSFFVSTLFSTGNKGI